MSNISNRHQIIPFVSGESKPFSGQRLAKVGYKSSKNQPARFKSICASVPTIPSLDIVEAAERMIPHIRNLLESAQDSIIRSLYESSGGCLDGINDDEISIDACIAYLESESNGGHLTKDYLSQWFKENVQDNLTVVIADKIGCTEVDDPRITVHINAYRGLFEGLSGAKTLYAAQQIQAIRKALEIASVDDSVSKKLIARLDSMEKKPKIEELLEL